MSEWILVKQVKWLETLGLVTIGDPPEGLFEVYLFMYCSYVVKSVAVEDDGGSKSKVEHIVACVLGAFGGSFINPALLGVPAPPIAMSKYLVALILAWIWQHNVILGRYWVEFLHTTLMSYVLMIGYEVFRCWVMFTWYSKAVATLGPDGYLGPIVVGTLGGCGGAFLPYTKGLLPLRNGAPWNVESAFYVITIFHCCNGLAFQATEDQLALLRFFMVCALLILRVFPSLIEVVTWPLRITVRYGLFIGHPAEQNNKGKRKQKRQ